MAELDPFATMRRSDCPRRDRRDLCRDDRGQWWQAVIGIVNGTVVVKAVPVPPRGGYRKSAKLRIAR